MVLKLNYDTPVFWKSGGIGLILTALAWAIWAINKTPIPILVIVFGIIITINGLLFFKGVPKGLKYWGLVLVIGNYLYLGTEAFCNLAVYKSWLKPEYFWPEEEIGVPLFPYFDKECAKFDSIRGFRWGVPARAVKIANGNLVFDNNFKPNNKGYISQLDYTFIKNDSTIFRWMVLGDSFTDGYYLENPWPDKANRILKDSVPHELYSFGINGGGITNWHSVFFKEIVPDYQFDGIVLAIFGNDLSRDFFAMHHQAPWLYFGWKSNHLAKESGIPAHNSSFEDSLSIIKNREFIEGRISEISGKGINRPNLFLLTKIVNFMRAKKALRHFNDEMHKIYSRELAISDKDEILPYNLEAYAHEFGPQFANKLKEIIKYAKTHNKKIILTTIPELPGLEMVHRKNPPVLQSKVRALAYSLDVNYFDGYNALATVNEDSFWELFLTFDGHWSQKGSDIFASHFAEYLKLNSDSIIQKP